MTTAVCGTVAPKIFEMDGVLHPAERPPINRVAGLVRPAAHSEPLSTEAEHLGHERQRVERAARVERAEDLFLASNLNGVARSQPESVGKRRSDLGAAHELRLSSRFRWSQTFHLLVPELSRVRRL